ncbi:helix-turn-helix domain-containing protein [Saccharothrix sp. BKS2]|uniref:helix-turn-helix domain-containing protein n=1 Tax=Saccharothrix sp. BKS2 TaxID=3064400 RepID=UPI0039E8C937
MAEVEGAYRLSPAEREVLRLRVVAALESRRVEGYRQAAEVFGVSERSVDTWWRAYRRDGRDGLATRKGRPGPGELIRLVVGVDMTEQGVGLWL